MIVFATNNREQVPPGQLLAAAKSDISIIPSPPTWAMVATAPADWIVSQPTILISSPPSSPANRQQESPFSDDDTDANWERLSMTSELDEAIAMDDHEPVVPLPETHFIESYSLAMTAAGLNVNSTKTRALLVQKERTKGRRMLVFAAIVWTIVTALATASSMGYFDNMNPSRQKTVANVMAPIPMKSPRATPPPTPKLVPESPSSKLTTMVQVGKRNANEPSMTPESEMMLQKYLLDGIVHSMGLEPYVDSSLETLREWTAPAVTPASKPQAVVKANPKIKLLRPIVRQLQRFGNLCKKVFSFVVRRKKNHQA